MGSLLVVVGGTVLATSVLLRPWPLDRPLSWNGDTFQHAALAQSATWSGSAGVSEGLGAPGGVDWSALPTDGERLHMLVLGALTDITGNVWTAGNLHLLMALVATSVVSLLVLRWLGAGELLAGAGAIVFTFSPVVYNHVAYGHPFLVGLYPIPLAVYLALRWGRSGLGGVRAPGGSTVRVPGASKWCWPTLISVVVIGLSSTYYSAYAVILLVCHGAVSAVRSRSWSPVLRSCVVATGILVTFALSSLGDLLSRSGVAPLERKLSDSTRFALRPLEMLLPHEGHPIGFLGRWGTGSDVAIGLLAAGGVCVLVVHLLRTIGRERGLFDRRMNSLAVLAALGLMIGVAGGLGWGVARLGFDALRVWSRISALIAFCAVAAVALVGQRVLSRPAGHVSGSTLSARAGALLRAHPVPLVVALVLLALLDQRAALPDGNEVGRAMAEDVDVVMRLGADLGDDPMVLQWPAVAFPDDFSSERLLAPGVLAEGQRFSAGAFRGGPGDWQQSWALQPLDLQIRAAAATGFDGLLVQVDHHLWGGDAATAEVTGTLGAPAGESPGGTWAWWDLRPLREEILAAVGPVAVERFGESVLRPIGTWVSGTGGFPSMAAERDAAIQEHGVVHLRAYGEDTSDAVMMFHLRATEGAKVEIRSGRHLEVLEAGPDGADQQVVVDLASGAGEVAISVEGRPLRSPVGGTAVYAELHDIAVFDAELVGSSVVSPSGFG